MHRHFQYSKYSLFFTEGLHFSALVSIVIIFLPNFIYTAVCEEGFCLNGGSVMCSCPDGWSGARCDQGEYNNAYNIHQYYNATQFLSEVYRLLSQLLYMCYVYPI